jgi:hypothetical protein
VARGPTFDNRQALYRHFLCDACGRRAILQTWESRPGGWFILFPPGNPMVLDPLEVHLCSEHCGIAWFRARAKARMVAAQSER